MSRALDPIDPGLWRRRAEWFWRAHDANAAPVAPPSDPRGELLTAELELAFCAGAWAAVVLLAWAVVERAERARVARGDPAPPLPEIDAVRERRNALAHDNPAVPPPDEATLEAWAQGALRTAFGAAAAASWR